MTHGTANPCYRHGHATRQGLSAEYRTWQGMKTRCSNPNATGYARYGGRGIAVCDAWKSATGFRAFMADMGPKPMPGHSIDRIDPNGNYEPGNCRWATKMEQNSNTRRCHPLTIDGESATIAEWARRLGVPVRTLRDRVAAGWTGKRLTTPVSTLEGGPHKAGEAK